jgi:hypothetical protein
VSSVYPNQRRRDPQPLGRAGETALVAVCAVLVAVSLAALAGLGAACVVAGGGWVWPHGGSTITHTLGGLLSGRPGRGLPAVLARRVPGRVAVYSGVVAAELLLAALAVAGGVAFTRWHRPGDARGGMATRAEAAAVLGVGRLRGAMAIIRPDLYGATPSASKPTHGAPISPGEASSGEEQR